MIHFIDSHAHLTAPGVAEEAEDLLLRAKLAGVEAIINICTDSSTLQQGIELARLFSWVYNAAATTPHDVEKEGEELFPLMTESARLGKLVAVGETGLDYHYEHSDRALQKAFFVRYLHLALEYRLPVIIHCRGAFADLFEILDVEYCGAAGGLPGVLHCFTGTAAEAEEVIKRGWYLSLSGIVTFKKSETLREVASMVPLDQLLIETDTPYLAPQSHRGKPNEPAFLPETAALIAETRHIPLDILASATSANARRCFNIKS